VVLCAGFVLVAGCAGGPEIRCVQGELRPARCGLDFVDCGCEAGADAWVSDLALVMVAIEDAASDRFPFGCAGDATGVGAWACPLFGVGFAVAAVADQVGTAWCGALTLRSGHQM
jgi:hypothetical protein